MYADSQIEFYTLEEINARYLARMSELIEPMQEILQAFSEAAEHILDAIRQWWEDFCRKMRKILTPYLVDLGVVYEELQRTSFYIRLCRWHLPDWIAAPVSRYWPRRWLPAFDPFELFDKVEQKS